MRVDPVGEPVRFGREEVWMRVGRDARDLREVLLEKRLVDRDRRVVHEAIHDRFVEKAAEESMRELSGRRDVGGRLDLRLHDFARSPRKDDGHHGEKDGGVEAPGCDVRLHGAFSR
jgi:hypothetical protein